MVILETPIIKTSPEKTSLEKDSGGGGTHPPKDRNNGGEGGGEEVIIAHFYRPSGVLVCEGKLHWDRLMLRWEVDTIGTLYANGITGELTETLSLTPAECEIMSQWTRHGYVSLTRGE